MNNEIKNNAIKEVSQEIDYNGKKYKIVFNLNVMQAIQDKFGSLDKWEELTDTKGKEINIEALLFGFKEMLNEGIDIDNEKNGTDIPLLTQKQVGRILTEIGLNEALTKVNGVVVDSSKSDEKNA